MGGDPGIEEEEMITQKSAWKKGSGNTEWYEISGKQCDITLRERPHYCDRGNWLANLFPDAEFAREIDGQDLWPRYYMDLDRAKLEIEDWMKKRGQWV